MELCSAYGSEHSEGGDGLVLIEPPVHGRE